MGKHVDRTTQGNLLNDIKGGMKVAEAAARTPSSRRSSVS
jgi:hypothetical protein